MTTDRQIEAVARAIVEACAHNPEEVGEKDWLLWRNEAKAAITVMSKELSSVLNVGGVKHPQQAEWSVMLAEVEKLRKQAKHIPMLVEALSELVKVKYIKDTHGKCDDYLRRVIPAWESARKALSQLPPELRGE